MNSYKKIQLPPIVTIIGHDTEVAGGISFTQGLHVDGVVHGDVQASEANKSALTVSHNGRIEGNVWAQNLRLDGRIVGDVHVRERVELGADASIEGDLYYGLLEMAMGAEVNGRLLRRNDPEKS